MKSVNYGLFLAVFFLINQSIASDVSILDVVELLDERGDYTSCELTLDDSIGASVVITASSDLIDEKSCSEISTENLTLPDWLQKVVDSGKEAGRAIVDGVCSIGRDCRDWAREKYASCESTVKGWVCSAGDAIKKGVQDISGWTRVREGMADF